MGKMQIASPRFSHQTPKQVLLRTLCMHGILLPFVLPFFITMTPPFANIFGRPACAVGGTYELSESFFVRLQRHLPSSGRGRVLHIAPRVRARKQRQYSAK